ncbi:MAG TPA: hypothetical protein VK477_04460, partial [Acidobacteriota bacterium]|nr:hypothetical protein [Acidobacteriota bacterium]
LETCVFFHLAWPREALFVTCAVTLPLLAGAALTGLLHAVLHRPHALLIPDLLPKLRRAAAFAYVALAAVVTLACKLAEPAAPAVGVFGLALGLLTLSCANRRLGFPRLKWLGLLSGSITVAVAWLVFHLRFAHDLLPALQAAPWAFLASGVALASMTFSLGFSRRTLRQRATTPYFASAYTWDVFLNRATFSRQVQELNRFNVSRGIDSQPGSSRHWPLRTVGPRVRDWLRVLDHQRAISPARLRAVMFVFMVGQILGLMAMFRAFGMFTDDKTALATPLSALLATLTAPAISGQDGFSSIMLVAVVIPPLIGVMMGNSVSRPLLSYPLGRDRLAEVVFAHAGRQLVGELISPCLALWLASFVGQVITGGYHAGFGLPVIAVIVLAYLPFLPLLALGGFGGGPRPAQFAIRGTTFFVGMAAAVWVVIARAKCVDTLLSPAGIALSLLATLGTLALLRWRIQRHYRTCDLTHEAAWATPFGAAGASGR